MGLSIRDSRALPFVAAAAVSLALGWSVPAETSMPPLVALAGLALVLVGVLVYSGRRLLASIDGEGTAASLGSVLLAVVWTLSVLFPAVARYFGAGTSKLPLYGVFFTHPNSELRHAALVTLLAMLAFFGGELLGSRGRHRPAPPIRTRLGASPLGIYFTLLALAALGTLAAPGATIENRGQLTGRGLSVMLFWALPLAISWAVINRHWGRRWLVVLDLCLIAGVLVPTADRSPLMLIACAGLVRLLDALPRLRGRIRTVLVVITLAYVLVSFLSAISTWRGEIRSSQSANLGTAFVQQLGNTTLDAKLSGLDTLDGLLLAPHVNRAAVGASYLDPLKAVYEFIPTQLWHAKPGWISASMARVYLGWKAGGVFYGGQGWALVVFGGVLGVVLWFLLVGFVVGRALTALPIRSIGVLLWAYFLVRFSAAGDSFNMFHTLMLLIVFYIGSGLSVASGWLIPRSSASFPVDAPS